MSGAPVDPTTTGAWAELTRLADERRTHVSNILNAQLSPLRKLLRARIDARLRSNRSHA